MTFSEVWSEVWSDFPNHSRDSRRCFHPTQWPARLTRLPAGLLLALLLTGCEGKGCFGLCDERDDGNTDDAVVTDPEDPTVDLSCYRTGRTVRREFTQPYATEATGEQVLRFFDSSLASSTALRPLLVWVTGNTWESGTSVADSPSLARDFAERIGAHFAVVSYRQSDAAEWPAQIVDVKTAVRFLKAQNNAQNYNIDLEQIYIGGDQAGATLAALTAYTGAFADFEPTEFPEQTDEPNLLIALGGMYNFDTVLANNADLGSACAGTAPNIDELAIRRLFDCAAPAAGASPLAECDAEVLRLASPIQYLGPSSPKTLFYHGALDCEVPIAQSEELDNRFDSSGADSILRENGRFVPLPDEDQSFSSLTATAILQDLAGFAEFDCDDNT